MNTPLSSKHPWLGTIVLIIGIVGSVAALGEVLLFAWRFLDPRSVLWDTSIYLAMGRSFLNGLTLYRDVFDLKPPGIFFLSALSLGIFGDGRLGNIFGAVALIAFPLATLAIVWPVIRKENYKLPTRPYRTTSGRATHYSLALLAILIGAFWSLFQAISGGPWQTEPFGAVFSLIYVYVLFRPPQKNLYRILLAAIGLLGSIGMKEPFIISCAAAALLVSENPKDFVQKFLIPLGVALSVGAIIMAILGILLPYLSYYLPSVLFYRGYDFAPVWMRGLGIGILLRNVAKVSPVAPIAFLALTLFGLFLRHKNTRWRIWTIGSGILALYLALLSIGIAGDYQSHHFIFIAPTYLTLSFIVLRRSAAALHQPRICYATYGLLILFSLVFFLPHLSDPRYREDTYNEKIAAAAILDDLLDACDTDRYLSVIGNDIGIHGFTVHSPINHSLFWQIDDAIQYGQNFLDISIERLSQADIIVVPNEGFTPSNDIGDMMAAYIVSTFTTDRPLCAGNIPDLPGHYVLFRQKDTPLNLDIDFIGDA